MVEDLAIVLLKVGEISCQLLRPEGTTVGHLLIWLEETSEEVRATGRSVDQKSKEIVEGLWKIVPVGLKEILVDQIVDPAQVRLGPVVIDLLPEEISMVIREESLHDPTLSKECVDQIDGLRTETWVLIPEVLISEVLIPEVLIMVPEVTIRVLEVQITVRWVQIMAIGVLIRVPEVQIMAPEVPIMVPEISCPVKDR